MTIENDVHKYIQSGRSWYQRAVNNITRITIHHDAIPNNGRFTDEEVLTNIMKEHASRGWPGASYHFWISKKGVIHQLNNFTDITWHDGVNSDSIGVCLNGWFHPDYNEKPTVEQLKAFKWLMDQLCTKHPEFPASFKDIRGHRERKATACPGNYLFPYVVEYREKDGNVNWGEEEPLKPVIITLDINNDIPTDIEEKLGLKDHDRYKNTDLKRKSMTDLLDYLFSNLKDD